MSKKKKKGKPAYIQPQHHQLSLGLTFPGTQVREHQLPLIFPKYERPAPQPPKPFIFVFDGFTGGYQRNGIFNLEDVFNFLGEYREFGSDLIQLVSQRYFLFADNHICVRCGLVGMYFAKERSAKTVKVPIPGTGRHKLEHRALNGERSAWHLNMYALKVLANGQIKEILMTKDHILPRAKGGLDIMSNYQTMCSICNGHKGDKLTVPPISHNELPVVEAVPEVALVAVE